MESFQLNLRKELLFIFLNWPRTWTPNQRNNECELFPLIPFRRIGPTAAAMASQQWEKLSPSEFQQLQELASCKYSHFWSFSWVRSKDAPPTLKRNDNNDTWFGMGRRHGYKMYLWSNYLYVDMSQGSCRGQSPCMLWKVQIFEGRKRKSRSIFNIEEFATLLLSGSGWRWRTGRLERNSNEMDGRFRGGLLDGWAVRHQWRMRES